MTKTATPPSPRTQIRRVRERGHYDQQTIESIAQESLICHIAFADDRGGALYSNGLLGGSRESVYPRLKR